MKAFCLYCGQLNSLPEGRGIGQKQRCIACDRWFEIRAQNAVSDVEKLDLDEWSVDENPSDSGEWINLKPENDAPLDFGEAWDALDEWNGESEVFSVDSEPKEAHQEASKEASPQPEDRSGEWESDAFAIERLLKEDEGAQGESDSGSFEIVLDDEPQEPLLSADASLQMPDEREGSENQSSLHAQAHALQEDASLEQKIAPLARDRGTAQDAERSVLNVELQSALPEAQGTTAQRTTVPSQKSDPFGVQSLLQAVQPEDLEPEETHYAVELDDHGLFNRMMTAGPGNLTLRSKHVLKHTSHGLWSKFKQLLRRTGRAQSHYIHPEDKPHPVDADAVHVLSSVEFAQQNEIEAEEKFGSLDQTSASLDQTLNAQDQTVESFVEQIASVELTEDDVELISDEPGQTIQEDEVQVVPVEASLVPEDSFEAGEPEPVNPDLLSKKSLLENLLARDGAFESGEFAFGAEDRASESVDGQRALDESLIGAIEPSIDAGEASVDRTPVDSTQSLERFGFESQEIEAGELQSEDPKESFGFASRAEVAPLAFGTDENAPFGFGEQAPVARGLMAGSPDESFGFESQKTDPALRLTLPEEVSFGFEAQASKQIDQEALPSVPSFGFEAQAKAPLEQTDTPVDAAFGFEARASDRSGPISIPEVSAFGFEDRASDAFEVQDLPEDAAFGFGASNEIKALSPDTLIEEPFGFDEHSAQNFKVQSLSSEEPFGFEDHLIPEAHINELSQESPFGFEAETIQKAQVSEIALDAPFGFEDEALPKDRISEISVEVPFGFEDRAFDSTDRIVDFEEATAFEPEKDSERLDHAIDRWASKSDWLNSSFGFEKAPSLQNVASFDRALQAIDDEPGLPDVPDAAFDARVQNSESAIETFGFDDAFSDQSNAQLSTEMVDFYDENEAFGFDGETFEEDEAEFGFDLQEDAEDDRRFMAETFSLLSVDEAYDGEGWSFERDDSNVTAELRARDLAYEPFGFADHCSEEDDREANRLLKQADTAFATFGFTDDRDLSYQEALTTFLRARDLAYEPFGFGELPDDRGEEALTLELRARDLSAPAFGFSEPGFDAFDALFASSSDLFEALERPFGFNEFIWLEFDEAFDHLLRSLDVARLPFGFADLPADASVWALDAADAEIALGYEAFGLDLGPSEAVEAIEMEPEEAFGFGAEAQMPLEWAFDEPDFAFDVDYRADASADAAWNQAYCAFESLEFGFGLGEQAAERVDAIFEPDEADFGFGEPQIALPVSAYAFDEEPFGFDEAFEDAARQPIAYAIEPFDMLDQESDGPEAIAIWRERYAAIEDALAESVEAPFDWGDVKAEIEDRAFDCPEEIFGFEPRPKAPEEEEPQIIEFPAPPPMQVLELDQEKLVQDEWTIAQAEQTVEAIEQTVEPAERSSGPDDSIEAAESVEAIEVIEPDETLAVEPEEIAEIDEAIAAEPEEIAEIDEAMAVEPEEIAEIETIAEPDPEVFAEPEPEILEEPEPISEPEPEILEEPEVLSEPEAAILEEPEVSSEAENAIPEANKDLFETDSEALAADCVIEEGAGDVAALIHAVEILDQSEPEPLSLQKPARQLSYAEYINMVRKQKRSQTRWAALALVLGMMLAMLVGGGAVLFAVSDKLFPQTPARKPGSMAALGVKDPLSADGAPYDREMMRALQLNGAAGDFAQFDPQMAARLNGKDNAEIENLQEQIKSLETRLNAMPAPDDQLLGRLSGRVDLRIKKLEDALALTGFTADELLDARLRRGGVAVTNMPMGGPFVPAESGYVNPIAGNITVMSGFGERGDEMHGGVDIPASIGTPVRSVADGEVIFVQDRAAWRAREKWVTKPDGSRVKSPGWRAGVYLEVKHADGRVSRYMHLDEIAGDVKKGSMVLAGQIIGTVGRTAVEFSDTHLHFELREPGNGSRYGAPLNPSTTVLNEGPPIMADAAKQADKKIGEGDEVSLLDQRMNRLQMLEDLARRLPLGLPVDRVQPSSDYGKRRDPVNFKLGIHNGLDLPDERETPIYAAGPGKVTFAEESGAHGLMVEVDHGDGIITRYAHLDHIVVRPGRMVTGHEKIGNMGDSGRTTGVHLHYEIRVDGVAVDPMRFIEAGRAASVL